MGPFPRADYVQVNVVQSELFAHQPLQMGQHAGVVEQVAVRLTPVEQIAETMSLHARLGLFSDVLVQYPIQRINLLVRERIGHHQIALKVKQV